MMPLMFPPKKTGWSQFSGGVKSCEPIDEDMIDDTIFKPVRTIHQERMHYHLL